jgi:hypothetical protein
MMSYSTNLGAIAVAQANKAIKWAQATHGSQQGVLCMLLRCGACKRASSTCKGRNAYLM